MLDEGLVHILATDSHGVDRRPPLLAEGMEAAKRWVGAEEARRLVIERPAAALKNEDPSQVQPIPASIAGNKSRAKSFLGRIFS
jgi:protein-tyrosine phosphatase